MLTGPLFPPMMVSSTSLSDRENRSICNQTLVQICHYIHNRKQNPLQEKLKAQEEVISRLEESLVTNQQDCEQAAGKIDHYNKFFFYFWLTHIHFWVH